MRYQWKVIGVLSFLHLNILAAPPVGPMANTNRGAEVENLKQQIVSLAQTFEGRGDPDFAIQNQLEPLVQQLIALAPQPPVQDRLEVLYGAWKQVWGPYDYRNDDRGVDPELGVAEIYQVIFPGGYYYNVSPLYKNGDRTKERIGLLRGEFRLDDPQKNILRVRFTDYPGNKTRPSGIALWDLAPLAEAGQLPDKVQIVPRWIVRMFFGGGALTEVYTDRDLRILYGSNGRNFERAYLYIMTRADGNSAIKVNSLKQTPAN